MGYALSGSRVNALISAASTDDEIGTVLRLHLFFEHLLGAFLDARSIIFKERATFFQKLELSFGGGLPVEFASAIGQINDIRNKLAHQWDDLDEGDVLRLAQLVNATIPSGGSPVENHQFQMSSPSGVQGPVHDFAGSNNRVKFLIAVGALINTFVAYLDSENLITPGLLGSTS